MNLYFRFIALIIKWFFAKSQGPLECTSRTFRVWPNDLDINFHMNNGRYLTIMDLGRCDLVVKSTLWRPVLKNKWVPIISSVKVQFIRSLKPFQKFNLTTQVIYWDEKWIYMEQKFYYKEKLMAHAFVKGLFIKKRDKITPQEILSSVPGTHTKPEAPLALMDWINSENTETRIQA